MLTPVCEKFKRLVPRLLVGMQSISPTFANISCGICCGGKLFLQSKQKGWDRKRWVGITLG